MMVSFTRSMYIGKMWQWWKHVSLAISDGGMPNSVRVETRQEWEVICIGKTDNKAGDAAPPPIRQAREQYPLRVPPTL